MRSQPGLALHSFHLSALIPAQCADQTWRPVEKCCGSGCEVLHWGSYSRLPAGNHAGQEKTNLAPTQQRWCSRKNTCLQNTNRKNARSRTLNRLYFQTTSSCELAGFKNSSVRIWTAAKINRYSIYFHVQPVYCMLPDVVHSYVHQRYKPGLIQSAGTCRASVYTGWMNEWLAG